MVLLAKIRLPPWVKAVTFPCWLPSEMVLLAITVPPLVTARPPLKLLLPVI